MAELVQYVVRIDEQFTHSLILEAASKDDALAAAYELLRNGLSKEEEILFDYELISDGFTGEHDANEY